MTTATLAREVSRCMSGAEALAVARAWTARTNRPAIIPSMDPSNPAALTAITANSMFSRASIALTDPIILSTMGLIIPVPIPFAPSTANDRRLFARRVHVIPIPVIAPLTRSRKTAVTRVNKIMTINTRMRATTSTTSTARITTRTTTTTILMTRIILLKITNRNTSRMATMMWMGADTMTNNTRNRLLTVDTMISMSRMKVATSDTMSMQAMATITRQRKATTSTPIIPQRQKSKIDTLRHRLLETNTTMKEEECTINMVYVKELEQTDQSTITTSTRSRAIIPSTRPAPLATVSAKF
mmetsp:Transcript_11383/g.28034  ORF Transcript_11383/g.28034 Transcript_11383/m.28034 type:complete len:299 (+) Transcript_11383:1217-2113(+)